MMVGGREAMEEEKESFHQSLLRLHLGTFRLRLCYIVFLKYYCYYILIYSPIGDVSVLFLL